MLLLWAVLQGKALSSAGSCSPFHLAAPRLQHLQNSAAIQASRGLSPAADLSHQGLEAFLALLHQPWKRFPCTHRPPGSIFPASPSSLCPRGWGPAGDQPGVGGTAAVVPGQSRQGVAAPSRPSYGSPAPFQLLQLSARHALRSFWPFPFLINFISIAQRSAGRLIAVLVLAEPGADLSLRIWGELGAARRENRLVPVQGNPSPTGQIRSDSAVRSSRDSSGDSPAAEVSDTPGFWEYSLHVVCRRDLEVEGFGAHQESCPQQRGCVGVLAAGSSRVFGHRAPRAGTDCPLSCYF